VFVGELVGEDGRIRLYDLDGDRNSSSLMWTVIGRAPECVATANGEVLHAQYSATGRCRFSSRVLDDTRRGDDRLLAVGKKVSRLWWLT
jgi:hypothetical protein